MLILRYRLLIGPLLISLLLESCTAMLPYAVAPAALLPAGFSASPPPHRVFLPFISDRGGLVGSPGPQPGPAATLSPTATLAPTATRTPTPTRTPRPTRTPLPSPTPASTDPILLSAGDIARCGSPGDAQTAAILAKYPSGAVAPLGDNAYESGSPTEYQTCYDPTWGPFKNRTYPAVGNHDYLTAGASGYFGYFGSAAGSPSQGYYSYTLGAWHLVVLNSDCSDAGGCGTSSPQGQWLAADLKAHPAMCTLAYWHQPYFSSGEWGDNTFMQALVKLLYNAGADVMLAGHDHDYERFAPQDPSGALDPAQGIVQFVAGTGGSNHTVWGVLQPNSLVRDNTDFGILKLTLHATSYDWRFIPVSGSFTDSGTAACH